MLKVVIDEVSALVEANCASRKAKELKGYQSRHDDAHFLAAVFVSSLSSNDKNKEASTKTAEDEPFVEFSEPYEEPPTDRVAVQIAVNPIAFTRHGNNNNQVGSVNTLIINNG